MLPAQVIKSQCPSISDSLRLKQNIKYSDFQQMYRNADTYVVSLRDSLLKEYRTLHSVDYTTFDEVQQEAESHKLGLQCNGAKQVCHR